MSRETRREARRERRDAREVRRRARHDVADRRAHEAAVRELFGHRGRRGPTPGIEARPVPARRRWRDTR